ncbi:MAG: C40 family peptidase [Oscillospiraceae bacterium]|nr:C40 family peptidase [Oscillospiraceae bacterium]
MKREPRLQFTDEERAAPELKKAIQKVDKAAAKTDKAQSKIPTKKVLAKERTADPATGKIKTRLHFEEMEKKPPSKLAHVTADTPINALSMQFHREVQQSEDDNVGVESAHKLEEAAEGGGRLIQSAHRSHQLKPYREATRAEHQLEKANVNALQKKAQTETPQSNPYSKWQQKQAIKKQYAAAKSGKTTENATKTAEAATKAAKKAAEKAKEAGEFVWRHKKGFAIAAGLLLILAFFLNGLSSCSVIMDGIASGITATTYASEDAAIEGAEEAYCGMEEELQDYLDNYERTHDYDEYHYDLDSIGHDPYVLISILSALHPGEWTLSDVQGTLQMLFEKQYILTETVTSEIRYRTEIRTGYRVVTDPNTGQSTLVPYQYEVEVPYTYYICTVTLENFDLSHVPVYIMSEEQLGMYAAYMSTLGNRPDLFGDSEYIGRYGEGSYTDYDIPPEALEDEVFAAMIEEAEKYLGYPYVWGGSSPSTSFDCSGFVSWVINHSGWDVGRLGAQGLCNICTPVSASNAQPGDLVFFVGTYDTPGVSHVGIYVGNNMMIHCGDPISYANLNSNYWQEHFYCYGRLP